MPICVSYKRLDEIDEDLKGKPDTQELLAIIAELRRCRKLLGKLNPIAESCKNLLEHFDEYRNGWLGTEWVDRIGLPNDIQIAREVMLNFKKGKE